MFSFVRSLVLALVAILAVSITPVAAQTHGTPTRLEPGFVYSIITDGGDTVVLRGDNEMYNVAHVNVRIPLSAIPTAEQRVLYTPNFGDPEPFYSFVPAPSSIVDSWVSSDPIKGNLLTKGKLHLVIMKDGNRVVMIGDGHSYDVLLYLGSIPLSAVSTDGQAMYTPNAGQPDPFWTFVPASEAYLSSLRAI